MADYRHMFESLTMPSKKKRSQRQEKKCAKDFKGSTVMASGALWFSKSDVVSDKFRIENKSTLKDQFRLHSSIWEKIRMEAHKSGKIPLIEILIGSTAYIVTSLLEYNGLVDKESRIAKPLWSLESKTFLISNKDWVDGIDFKKAYEVFKFKDSDIMIVVPKRSFLINVNVV